MSHAILDSRQFVLVRLHCQDYGTAKIRCSEKQQHAPLGAMNFGWRVIGQALVRSLVVVEPKVVVETSVEFENGAILLELNCVCQ